MGIYNVGSIGRYLNSTAQQRGFPTQAIDTLNDPNNYGSAVRTLTGHFSGLGGGLKGWTPNKSRTLQSRAGDIYGMYNSLSHLPFNEDLMFTGFLQHFDPFKYLKDLSPQERGERPYAYGRGFRTLGG